MGLVPAAELIKVSLYPGESVRGVVREKGLVSVQCERPQLLLADGTSTSIQERVPHRTARASGQKHVPATPEGAAQCDALTALQRSMSMPICLWACDCWLLHENNIERCFVERAVITAFSLCQWHCRSRVQCRMG